MLGEQICCSMLPSPASCLQPPVCEWLGLFGARTSAWSQPPRVRSRDFGVRKLRGGSQVGQAMSGAAGPVSSPQACLNSEGQALCVLEQMAEGHHPQGASPQGR